MAPPSSSTWNSGGPESSQPINYPTDVESLKRHQIEALEQQNRGLDVLSATISRQRALGIYAYLRNKMHVLIFQYF